MLSLLLVPLDLLLLAVYLLSLPFETLGSCLLFANLSLCLPLQPHLLAFSLSYPLSRLRYRGLALPLQPCASPSHLTLHLCPCFSKMLDGNLPRVSLENRTALIDHLVNGELHRRCTLHEQAHDLLHLRLCARADSGDPGDGSPPSRSSPSTRQFCITPRVDHDPHAHRPCPTSWRKT